MTINELRKMLRAEPFRPFEIHLADGRSLSVDHPEFVGQAPSGRTISVGQVDGFEIVDLLQNVHHYFGMASRPDDHQSRFHL